LSLAAPVRFAAVERRATEGRCPRGMLEPASRVAGSCTPFGAKAAAPWRVRAAARAQEANITRIVLFTVLGHSRSSTARRRLAAREEADGDFVENFGLPPRS
jgi:hypothetical protein